MDKPARVYSIRKVSEMIGVPPRTIRLWEKHLQHSFTPERTPGGQRCYTEADIATLRELVYWVNGQGLSLPGAARAIQQPSNSRGKPMGRTSPLHRKSFVTNGWRSPSTNWQLIFGR